MTEPADLIIATALIDMLVFPDGASEPNVPGGAGLYALAGAALFSDRAVLVTGTGADYVDCFGPWMARNNLGAEGLRIADIHTPRNLLRYADEHTRSEEPVFGADHFARMEPRAGDVAPLLTDARSLYVFRNTERAFWDEFLAVAGNRQIPILWEIGLDACMPEERSRIEDLLGHVDAISLNLEEAALIFGLADEAELVERVRQWPVRHVFLRAGRRGSYAISDGTAQFVPSLEVVPVDVTGGGNAYSGAALVGLATGRSSVEAAIMGTVAASIAIAQLGLPESGSPFVRRRAQLAVAALGDKMHKDAEA
jgi:sugar/nucleoside kinase (ribokinase family)